MKALVDRLEWVRLYLVDPNCGDAKMKEIALDECLAAMAIAEALPDITISVPGGVSLARDASVSRRGPPPERIIALPE